MGTRERRQRENAEREQLFLASARELVCRDGLLRLQMAKVAQRCDYAIGTLYQHFASKEDLLLALSSELSCKRVELFQRVARWQAGSRDRVFALAVADMLFARRYPEHFRLTQYVCTDVVWRAATQQRRDQALEECRPMGEVVLGILNDAIAAGDLNTRGYSPFELAIGQWTMTVGMHTLVHTEGLLDLYDVHKPYRLMLMHAQMLLNGMGWKPLADPYDRPALDALIERIASELFADMPLPAEAPDIGAGSSPEDTTNPQVTAGEGLAGAGNR